MKGRLGSTVVTRQQSEDGAGLDVSLAGKGGP